MSQSSRYNLTCPKCKTPHEAVLYHSVNVEEEPDLRVQLLSGRLNAVACPSCGLTYRVDKPVLYNDPERRIMIYLMPARLDQVPELEDQFLDMMKSVGNVVPDDEKAPHFHLVLSRSELVERVFVIEAGLDPRVIEYLKYSIYTRNMEKIPYEEKALLFNVQDSTDEEIFFVVQDVKTLKLESVIQHSRARHLRVICAQPHPDVLSVSIEDDGSGFDVEEVQQAGVSVGLRSMTARAERMGGKLTVFSGHHGTVVRVVLSLDKVSA